MGFGGAGRDDANDFFVVIFIKGMDNHEDRSRSYRSDRDPALLIVRVVVSPRNGVGIIENENGSLKPDVMFAKVLAVLVLVPRKSHGNDTIQHNYKNGFVNTVVRTRRKSPQKPVTRQRHAAPGKTGSET